MGEKRSSTKQVVQNALELPGPLSTRRGTEERKLKNSEGKKNSEEGTGVKGMEYMSK